MFAFIQRSAPQSMRFSGESAPFGVGEADTSSTQPLLQQAVLSLKIFNHSDLRAIAPTGKHQHQILKGRERRGHRRREYWTTCALPLRQCTDDALVSIFGHYAFATLAKAIGRRVLIDLNPIVLPATLLRWHRELVAKKSTFLEQHRPDRPRTKLDIEQLIVRMANDNPGWGYTRIQYALMNLDVTVGRGTIRRILKDHLVEPAPIRGRRISWSTFLKAHWRALAASDFLTIEVWSWQGLITVYVLHVIELSTR